MDSSDWSDGTIQHAKSLSGFTYFVTTWRQISARPSRQAKTSFPGLGSPITSIDVTHDGKWILAGQWADHTLRNRGVNHVKLMLENSRRH
jgi:hypothetical protein